MTSTLTVPGGMVELRDKPTVGGRELIQETLFDMIATLRRKMPDVEVERLSDLQDLPLEKIDGEFIRSSNQLQRAGVVAFVKSWSFRDPLPTMANVGDMDPDVYDALAKITSPMIASAVQGLNFEDTPENIRDPKAPRSLSSDSGESEKDQAAH